MGRIQRSAYAVRTAPANRAEPAQAHGQKDDEKRSEDKIRHARSDRGEAHANVIKRTVMVQRRERSERQPDDDRKQKRQHAELRSDEESIPNNLRNVAVVL